MPKTKKGVISNEIVIYAFAHVETWIEDYAKSTGESPHELTERVATLLLSQRTGIINNVSSLRRKTTKAYKTVVPMEMDERTHSQSRRKNSSSKIIAKKRRSNKKLKAYWAKFTPEQRSKEMYRRLSQRGK